MALPSNMKAVVQLHDGLASASANPAEEDLSAYISLSSIPIPTPGEGQAVIRVHLAAVNPSDILFIKGQYGDNPRVKGVPAGFEGVGEVVAGDTPLVGRRVGFFGGASGTWAEYAIANIEGLVPVRHEMDEKDAAGLIVNPLTAIAMFDIVKQSGADSFVLNAAGSALGKMLIALGSDAGVQPVAVVRRADQSEALKKLGASEVIVSKDAKEGMSQAEEVFGRVKPVVFLDAVGDQFAADLFSALPDNARWVNYGKLSHEAPALKKLAQLIFQNKKIEGFWLTRWLQSEKPERIAKGFEEIQDRFIAGKWTTDVAGVVPLSEAMTKLADALKVKDGKTFIDARL